MNIVIQHDIWQAYSEGYTICICTNGFIKKDGSNVMGRGLAKDASLEIPYLPALLGDNLRKEGNKVFWFETERIITFPTKQNWWEKSDLDLIEKSCNELAELVKNNYSKFKRNVVFLPIPGIGNGGLKKEIVMSLLKTNLDKHSNIVIVEKP